jgi:predicted TIM-barrel fold metal-dependent hydrolase
MHTSPSLHDRTKLDIVDAHHHIWDLGAGHYPWLQDEYQGADFFLGEYQTLRRDYLVPEYLRDTSGYNVIASVHVEAERSRSEQVDETHWLHEVRNKAGLPSVVVPHVSFIQADRDDILASHASYPEVRGIRSKPVTARSPQESVWGQAGTMQDPQWLEGLSALERYGFSWDLRVPFWHLAEAAEVAAAFPRIRIAINHTGLPWDRSDEGLSQWRTGLATLAANPNVFLKLSEFGLAGGRWDDQSSRRVIRDAVAIFGPDRAMFASNLPVSSISASFGVIVETVLDSLADYDDQAIARIFSQNAISFYRIDA